MSRQWMLLSLFFSLCSSGAAQANPLDSPDIAYINGLPCNRACQAYMAATDRALSARHGAPRETIVVGPAETEPQAVERAARPRVARQPVPVPRPLPRTGMASLSAKAPNVKKTATPNAASQPAVKAIPAIAATLAKPAEPAAEKSAAAAQAPERQPESAGRPEPDQQASIAVPTPAVSFTPEVAPAVVAEPPPAAPMAETAALAAPPPAPDAASLPAAATDAPAASRTIQEQVAEATGMADRVTAITMVRDATDTAENPGTESSEASVKDEAQSVAAGNPDNLVALVLARPEINSISKLSRMSIAIEEKQSAASGSVSAALMAAGAADVQFSEGQAGAIERLMRGEVAAAILTLASPEAAEWFPDIAGFRVFRLPLSSKAG